MTNEERERAQLIIASRQASELFARTLSAWNALYTFRRMGQIGMPHAAQQMVREHAQTINELLTAEEHARLFSVDRQVLIDQGMLRDSAAMLTQQSINTYRGSLDAAILIFAHSILDGLSLEWLKVCASANPFDYMGRVGRRQVRLEDVQNTSFLLLLNASIREYLAQLERESLLRKLDLLFEFCHPPAGFAGVQGYQYDRGRIDTLDKLRHEYVHGNALDQPLPHGDEDLIYLQHTCSFLLPLVHQRYGVHIDPYVTVAHFVGPQAAAESACEEEQQAKRQ